MELNIQEWEEFKVNKIFTMMNGKGITKEEIELNNGHLPAIQSGEENNGVLGKISETYCREMNYTMTSKPCLTVARTGSAGFVSYQGEGCVVGDSAKILLLNEDVANIYTYMFLQTILIANRYKYDYGRKVTEAKYLEEILKLPIQCDNEGNPIIDIEKKYSDKGYVPDWKFMEKYMKSLNCEPITTNVRGNITPDLDVDKWEEFYLKDLFVCCMGNGIDASATTRDAPVYNYVSRDSKGNGVVGFVDVVYRTDKKGNTYEENPFEPGTMTLALGGNFLGSCFVQNEPYYTAQNVAVLTEKEPLSLQAKIFISTLIRNECKYKYLAFGRELNTHYKTDFVIKLPIQRDDKGEPIIDTNKTYSKEGYIPDWCFMEDYMNSLPYSDRI